MLKHTVLAAVCAASVLIPAFAFAQDEAAPPIPTLKCRGVADTEKPKGGVDLTYTIGCNQSISSFSVIATQELDYFNSRAELANKSDGKPSAEGKAYECQGQIPGEGFACVGGDQPRSTRAFGDFSTTDPACDPEDRTKSFKAWFVVQYVEGEGEKARTVTSEPFALHRDFKCPRPSKSARKRARR